MAAAISGCSFNKCSSLFWSDSEASPSAILVRSVSSLAISPALMSLRRSLRERTAVGATSRASGPLIAMRLRSCVTDHLKDDFFPNNTATKGGSGGVWIRRLMNHVVSPRSGNLIKTCSGAGCSGTRRVVASATEGPQTTIEPRPNEHMPELSPPGAQGSSGDFLPKRFRVIVFCTRHCGAPALLCHSCTNQRRTRDKPRQLARGRVLVAGKSSAPNN